MAVSYPPTLPGVKFSSLLNRDVSAVRSDDSEIGPATYQLLSLDGPTIFEVQFAYYPFDFAVFEGWFRYDLLKGALSFDIELPVGSGIKSHEVNFVDGYSATYTGRFITVSATLRAIAKVYHTESEFDDLLLLSNFIPERNKAPLIRSVLEFVGVTLPGAWQDVDYGTDTGDIDDLCELVLTKPTAPFDFSFGTITAPANVNSTNIPVDGCSVITWFVDIDPAVTESIKFELALPVDASLVCDLYVFDPAGTLRGSIIGVTITTGFIDFLYEASEGDTLDGGNWVIAATGHTSSDSAPDGLRCVVTLVDI